MKKTILLSAAILLFITTNAQLKLGATAGFGLSNALLKPTSNTEIDTRPIFGFHIGAVAKIEIAKSVIFRPGLVFMRRGTRTEFSSNTGVQTELKQTITLNYITLPLNFFYTRKISNLSLFLGAGPQIGYGISGRNTGESTLGNVTTTSDDPVDFGTTAGDDDLKPFDAGFNIEAGVEFPCSFAASFFYTAGLTNLELADDATWRNNVMGLSLFYYFN